MKFKHRLESLKARQAQFDRLDSKGKSERTRLGSNKK